MSYYQVFRNSAIGKYVVVLAYVFVSAAVVAGLNAMSMYLTNNKESISPEMFLLLTGVVNAALAAAQKYRSDDAVTFLPKR